MTTDPFTTAARAEAPPECDHHWISHGQNSALIPWVIRCDLCGVFNTAEMDRVARDHLAAQDEAAIRALATTTAHTGQDIVEAARIMRDVAQEPTDAEVEAAAVVIWESYDLLDRAAIRDALSAARAARRDEENR